MQLTELATDVYACLQPDRGLGMEQLRTDQPRRRRGRRHVLGPAAHARADRAVRARLEAAGAARRQHPSQRRPLLGQPALRRRRDHRPPPVRRELRQGTAEADAGAEEPGRLAAIRPWRLWRMRSESYDFSGIELTPPTTLIDERLDLDLDGLRVELLYVGPAHTAGDVIVHLPAQRIVFTGDMLFRLCTPIGWEGTFAKLDGGARPHRRARPRRDRPRPRAALRRRRAARDEGLPRVRAARGAACFDAGLSVDRGGASASTWARTPAGPSRERIVFNVDRAYRELRGEPYDAPTIARAPHCAAPCSALRDRWAFAAPHPGAQPPADASSAALSSSSSTAQPATGRRRPRKVVACVPDVGNGV